MSARALILFFANDLAVFSNAFNGIVVKPYGLNQIRPYKSRKCNLKKTLARQGQIRSCSKVFASMHYEDTAADLPQFDSKEEYTEYLINASALPRGFATGSAEGTFVPE